MTQNGLRVLAVAYRKIDENIKSFKELDNPVSELVFVGFLALKDPIRESVGQTVLIARKSGIKVAIITGDHRNTATAIAKEIGLEVDPENILEGKDLEAMNDEELKKVVKKITVYARILPHDKLRIVEALKAQGEVVAMTGDGINDAPALKKADIGIAVGAATDVAKETSDMVLLDNDFSSIAKAVEEGRAIYDNIKRFVNYLLSSNLGEVLILFFAIILAFKVDNMVIIPLTAVQILWINLVTDGLPALALGVDSTARAVMQ